MPKPYFVLPSVEVPLSAAAEVEAFDPSPWSQRELVSYFRAQDTAVPRPSRQPPSAKLYKILDDVCAMHGAEGRCKTDDALLVFGDVDRHNDPMEPLNRRRIHFLHVIVKGEGLLRFRTLREKELRVLPLRPGVAFVMNPSIHHEVTGAKGPYSIASLSANVHFAL